MVMVKRRTASAPKRLSCSVSSLATTLLPYGESQDPPKYCRASSSSLCSPDSKKSISWKAINKKNPLHSPLTKVIGALLAISWLFANYWNYHMRAALKGLQYDHQLESLHYKEAVKALKDTKKSQRMLQNQVQQLEQTKKALQHELRVSSELKEGETLGAPHNSISNYIEKRHAILQDKIDLLRKYIQEESRREVLSKFGPGPHRVKLTVKFVKTQQTKSLVMEMAPLELMPHSVHLFLELVAHKMWDNTSFWHRDGSTHVVTGVPINFQTGESRHHHLETLRLSGLSFAEHSKDYPHIKYTVGFILRGPVIYINTVDNSRNHGPGGQNHHDLEDEADPCFAKVVEGQEVVDELLQVNLNQETKQGSEEIWSDRVLTQIVKAEIL